MPFPLRCTEMVPSADEYYDLGAYSRAISTTNPDAQAWFDRGLVWSYAFNHEEAEYCFEQVISHDPDAVMGYWGIVFSRSPNYNKTWGAFDEQDLKSSMYACYHAAREAERHLDKAAPWEKALVRAIQLRFPDDEPLADYTSPSKAYADEMRKVYQEFGADDFDVITLFADALMNLAPKKMFEMQSGKPIPSSPVFEVKEVLERGLQLPGADTHPGMAHMYIHLMEMSETPEIALRPSEKLRRLVPDAGHLYHMPTHLDVLVGDYYRSMECNMKATLADDRFFARNGGKNVYSYYRLHNYHSLIYAAMLAAQSQVALDATTRMEATINEDMLLVRSPPLANWMEFFLSVRVHVYIRFGMWEEIKKLEIPADQDLYCVTTVMIHYGKGIAYASTGNMEKAKEERKLYRAAALRVPATRQDYPNRIVDILKVASAMLDGELEYRLGNYDLAFQKLREAIVHDDSLHYTEPWGWMLPTRHSYGALLLEQGHVEEAANAYAEDLGLTEKLTRIHQHPGNVWALHGYHECLLRLGRMAEARIIHKQLALPAARADVPIRSSCFCRLQVAETQDQSCIGCSE